MDYVFAPENTPRLDHSTGTSDVFIWLEQPIDLDLTEESMFHYEPDFVVPEDYTQRKKPNCTLYRVEEFGNIELTILAQHLIKKEWLIPEDTRQRWYLEDRQIASDNRYMIVQLDWVLEYLFRDSPVLVRLRYFKAKYGIYRYFMIYSKILRAYYITLKHRLFIIRETVLTKSNIAPDMFLGYNFVLDGKKYFVNNIKNYRYARILFNDIYSKEPGVCFTKLFGRLLLLNTSKDVPNCFSKHINDLGIVFTEYLDYETKVKKLDREVEQIINNISNNKWDSSISKILDTKQIRSDQIKSGVFSDELKREISIRNFELNRKYLDKQLRKLTQDFIASIPTKCLSKSSLKHLGNYPERFFLNLH